jgi:UDP-GlcNAc:undecaprenyl-phosphate GlcNAc-1-phosphate transferase
MLLSLALTYAFIKLSPKLGFMDIPKDDRRMHNTATPIAGGFAIYLAFLLSMCIAGLFKLLVPYAVCGLIIVIVGLADDKISLNPKIKLLGQAIAGTVLCFFGITVKNLTFFGHSFDLGWLAYPITVFWIVAVTNIFNLIDGLDGLCCGLSIIAAAIIGLLSFFDGNNEVTACALVYVFACLGFLPHNTYRAKIFMGDTGAMFSGFVLATLACQAVYSPKASIPALVPLVIFGIPVFDAVFAVIRRLIGKSNIFVGDKKHVHHRLTERYGHRNAVIFMYTAAMLLGGIALIISCSFIGEIIGLILTALAIGYGVARFGIYKG